MSPQARTVHLFGLYLMGVGLIATFVPNRLFDLLGVPTTEEPWIRLVGVVVLVLAGYYLVAARHELDGTRPPRGTPARGTPARDTPGVHDRAPSSP